MRLDDGAVCIQRVQLWRGKVLKNLGYLHSLQIEKKTGKVR